MDDYVRREVKTKICETCVNGRCTSTSVLPMRCGRYQPKDEEAEECIINGIHSLVPLENKTVCTRRPLRHHLIGDDPLPTLDQLHVRYINDVLSNIRHGGIDYIWDSEWLCELYSFEPQLEIHWNGDCWSVMKAGDGI